MGAVLFLSPVPADARKANDLLDRPDQLGTNTIPVAFKKPTAIGVTKPVVGSMVATKLTVPESFGAWV